MDIAVAFRGTDYAPTLALCPGVIDRASETVRVSSDPIIVCLDGRESAGQIAELLARDPQVLFVEPVTGLSTPARRTIEAFGRLGFGHGTPAIVLIAALIAVQRHRSLRAEPETAGSTAVPFHDDAVSD
jgi:hypothetical protein